MFFALRLLTNTVPLSPSASERASGMPSTQASTLKPLGTLSVLSGSSLAGRPVMCGANGCSVDSAMAGGLPPCQEGASAAGLSCAKAGAANAAATSVAMSFMGSPPLGTAIKSLLCASGAQQGGSRLPALVLGDSQRSLAPVVARIALGAALEQQLDGLVLAEAGRPHQGGQVVVVACVDVHPVLEQGA